MKSKLEELEANYQRRRSYAYNMDTIGNTPMGEYLRDCYQVVDWFIDGLKAANLAAVIEGQRRESELEKKVENLKASLESAAKRLYDANCYDDAERAEDAAK